MVNSEDNMTNLKDIKTKVTVGDHKTLTVKKRGDWHGCQKRNRKLHHLTLTNTAVIPGLHANLFSVTRALQKGFQLTSDGKTLILKKNSTKIRFDEKMANTAGEGFLFTTKFYKSANDAADLAPEKRNPEGNSAIQPEGMAVNKQ